MPVEDFDPFDPAAAGTHHRVMARLRDECPVATLPSGLTVVSRYRDVRDTLDATTMRNSHAARAPGVTVPPEDRLFFFEYDPPEHAMLRRVVLDLLSRRRTAAQAAAFRSLAADLVAPLVTRGSVDLVQELSVPLAGRLMMRVAGFPEEDAPRWRGWIKDMVVSGFSFTNRNERGVGFAACYPDVLAYLDTKLAARRGSIDRPDDVLTRVVTVADEDARLDRTLQRMILFSVVSAGTNTLVNFASNTLLALARDPTILDALRADRSLVPVAVEESLRRDSPSMFLTRVCAADTDVGGTHVHPGDRLLLGLASANRDAAVYPEPETFRLDRAGQPAHLAFGWGAHLCLGVWIAREAGAALLDAILDHVGTLEIEPGTTPVPYLSPQGNGLDELRVRLSPP